MTSGEKSLDYSFGKTREVVVAHFDWTLRHLINERLIGDNPVEVISVGCGAFLEAETLRRVFPNARIEGVDNDSLFFGLAKKRGALPKRVIFRGGDLTERKSFKGSYDLAIVRNPDIRQEVNWMQIFWNIKEALANRGKVLITCNSEDEQMQIAKMLEFAKLRVIFAERNENAIDASEKVLSFQDYIVMVAEE